MRKCEYWDGQEIAILREQEPGRPTADACRKFGDLIATFYKSKS